MPKASEKADGSPVTEADKAAEKIVLDALKEYAPDITIISEENTQSHTLTPPDKFFLVDPLDGTTNFLHQVPMFAVSVALQHHEETVLGVVYEVNRSECFSAWKGGGAFLNGHPIKVSPTKMLSE